MRCKSEIKPLANKFVVSRRKCATEAFWHVSVELAAHPSPFCVGEKQRNEKG